MIKYSRLSKYFDAGGSELNLNKKQNKKKTKKINLSVIGLFLRHVFVSEIFSSKLNPIPFKCGN